MDGAGVLTYYMGFGKEVTGAKYTFLRELMKNTYVPGDTGHHLDDVTAENPTGHAQGIYWNGEAYAYYNGKIREIVAEKDGKNLSHNVTVDGNEKNKACAKAL
jgi:hypothetical protein